MTRWACNNTLQQRPGMHRHGCSPCQLCSASCRERCFSTLLISRCLFCTLQQMLTFIFKGLSRRCEVVSAEGMSNVDVLHCLLQESLPAPLGGWFYMTRASADWPGLTFIRRDAAGHEEIVLDLSDTQHPESALGQVWALHSCCSRHRVRLRDP